MCKGLVPCFEAMEAVVSYVIRSIRETGTITYHCATTQNALEKVQDFRRAAYRDIVILNGDEHCLTEGNLLSLARAEQQIEMIHEM